MAVIKRWADHKKKNSVLFHDDVDIFEAIGGADEDGYRGLMVTTPVPPQSDYLLSENPCVRAFGPFPGPKSCRTCSKFMENVATEKRLTARGSEISVILHVCTERSETHAPTINHEPHWDACSRYEPKPE